MESKQSKGGGRPPKSQAEKHSHCVSFFVDFQTYFHLKASVRSSGLSRSEYLRQLIKHGKVVARCTPEELALYRGIIGLANNINTLTRRAHVYGLPNVQAELAETTKQLSSLLKQWSER